MQNTLFQNTMCFQNRYNFAYYIVGSYRNIDRKVCHNFEMIC